LAEKNKMRDYLIQEFENEAAIRLSAHEEILIPAGVKVDVPKGYTFNFENKSGVASKLGLIIGAKVIDHGYQGEVHINLINSTNQAVLIHEGQKIVQGIQYKINNDMVEIVPIDNLYNVESERSDGGFGSSDNK